MDTKYMYDQHVIYRLMWRPKLTWEKTNEERVPFLENCEICYACSLPVTWKGPLMSKMPLHLHVNHILIMMKDLIYVTAI